jgi:hypothetical protein
MELPIYRLKIIPEKDMLGVEELSLVDYPAMKTKWMAFNEEPKNHAFVINEDKQIVAFPIIAVDMPIYRRDDKGREYYVVFDRQVSEATAYKAMRDNIALKWNIDHDQNQKVSSVQLVESYIVDREKNKGVVAGHEHIMCGSWYGYAHIADSVIWGKVKRGELNGVSLEGNFIEVPMGEVEQETILDLLLN